ncbi:MAG: hypothetical protein U1F76_19300 [Candidatus Competibacteraceae bacterium]
MLQKYISQIANIIMLLFIPGRCSKNKLALSRNTVKIALKSGILGIEAVAGYHAMAGPILTTIAMPVILA